MLKATYYSWIDHGFLVLSVDRATKYIFPFKEKIKHEFIFNSISNLGILLFLLSFVLKSLFHNDTNIITDTTYL